VEGKGFATRVATRQGPFGILADDEAVLASGWGADTATLLAQVHPTLRPDAVVEVEPGALVDGPAVLAQAVEAVRAYNDATDLAAVARVPVKTHGSAFRQTAWDAMRAIPVGGHLSYAELAAKAGRPGAARAAGGACAGNPTPLFVPCHRVLASNGSLGGFAYGLPMKGDLLAAEAGDALPTS
jgi:methylated-DNA-[protein]-cysteine S-methyltransferase